MSFHFASIAMPKNPPWVQLHSYHFCYALSSARVNPYVCSHMAMFAKAWAEVASARRGSATALAPSLLAGRPT